VILERLGLLAAQQPDDLPGDVLAFLQRGLRELR